MACRQARGICAIRHRWSWSRGLLLVLLDLRWLLLLLSGILVFDLLPRHWRAHASSVRGCFIAKRCRAVVFDMLRRRAERRGVLE